VLTVELTLESKSLHKPPHAQWRLDVDNACDDKPQRASFLVDIV